MNNWVNRNWFPLMLTTGLLIHATSLLNGIMEVDAMLYATIAKHIALTNDWINLVGDGHDWLDKPHLPFWLIAASLKIFGINDFAYKLPGFGCFLVGVYYCYRLSKAMFNEQVARLSTIIYVSSLHLFLAVFDIRAEAFLTTFVLAATYHLYRSLPAKFSWHIMWAALFCAAACITKGIFVLATISGGFIMYWVYNRQWLEFFKPKWWLLLLLTGIFILPEIYCLYLQFDQHPEKIVFGTTNVSGVRFFFWDSQFGRFLNNGPIKGRGDLFFFVHTFLWAFLPWSLIGYVGVFYSFKQLVPQRSQVLILSGAAALTFVLFSLSKFQLPHYIVIVFPHFAILSALYLKGLTKPKTLVRWNYLLVFLFVVAILFVVLLAFVTRFTNVAWPLCLTSIAILCFILFYSGNSLHNLLGKGICFALLLYLYMNLFFYPALLTYQGGKNVAAYVNDTLPGRNAVMYRCNRYSFQWYAHAGVMPVNDFAAVPATFRQGEIMLVLTSPEQLPELKAACSSTREIKRFGDFHVSELTGPFLKKETREASLNQLILLECRVKW